MDGEQVETPQPAVQELGQPQAGQPLHLAVRAGRQDRAEERLARAVEAVRHPRAGRPEGRAADVVLQQQRDGLALEVRGRIAGVRGVVLEPDLLHDDLHEAVDGQGVSRVLLGPVEEAPREARHASGDRHPLLVGLGLPEAARRLVELPQQGLVLLLGRGRGEPGVLGRGHGPGQCCDREGSGDPAWQQRLVGCHGHSQAPKLSESPPAVTRPAMQWSHASGARVSGTSPGRILPPGG
jgi:hypothetical protein